MVALDRAGLILVDLQNDFLDPEGPGHRAGLYRLEDPVRRSLIENVRSLVAAARKGDKPVIWVKTVLRPDLRDSAFPARILEAVKRAGDGGFLIEGTRGSELLEDLGCQRSDFTVIKKGFSAFQFTSLDRLLVNLNLKKCVMAGGAALDCLADTVRQGGALGYEMVIPADATGYPPEAPQLKNLGNRAVLTRTAEVVAGLSSSRPAPQGQEKLALVLVDLQNEFVHPDGFHERLGYSHLSDEDRTMIIRNNQRLLRAMRERGYPVVFIVTTYRHDRLDDASSPTARKNRPMPPGEQYLISGSWAAEMVQGLEVSEGDFVVTKKGRSCFGFTPLHRILRNLGIQRCLITGGGINGCVEDSVREGVGLGYDFTIVSDATYEPNSPVLKLLNNRADSKSTDEVLALIRR